MLEVFAAGLRTLIRGGCVSNRVICSLHLPVLFRIPFGIYEGRLKKAVPKFAPAELLANTHGRLPLETNEQGARFDVGFVAVRVDRTKRTRFPQSVPRVPRTSSETLLLIFGDKNGAWRFSSFLWNASTGVGGAIVSPQEFGAAVTSLNLQ
jgi:hypothetical protein